MTTSPRALVKKFPHGAGNLLSSGNPFFVNGLDWSVTPKFLIGAPVIESVTLTLSDLRWWRNKS